MTFELPPLPYGRMPSSLSFEGTLEFHNGRQHAAYVKKLNELIRGHEVCTAPSATRRTARGGIEE